MSDHGIPDELIERAWAETRTLFDLPDEEKRHWRDMFDHYVFVAGPEVTAHIPPATRGVLAPLTAESAGRIRALLARAFGR